MGNQRLSTAPSVASRMSVNPIHTTPEIPAIEEGAQTIRRKKSASALIFRKDDLKLPREFLLEFWKRLAAEPGDSGWSQAVHGFLLLTRKLGTKTAAGANLREIPVLLESEFGR